MVTTSPWRTISPTASWRQRSRRASTETQMNLSLRSLTFASVQMAGARPAEPAAQQTVCGAPPAPDQTKIGLPSAAPLRSASSRSNNHGICQKCDSSACGLIIYHLVEFVELLRWNGLGFGRAAQPWSEDCHQQCERHDSFMQEHVDLRNGRAAMKKTGTPPLSFHHQEFVGDQQGVT